MSEELRTAKADIQQHQKEMRSAISAGEWWRAQTEAQALSELLTEIAAMEGSTS